jgi:hypothetical protein
MKSADVQQEGSRRLASGQEAKAAVVEVSWRLGDQVEITRRSRDYLEIRCLIDQREIN